MKSNSRAAIIHSEVSNTDTIITQAVNERSESVVAWFQMESTHHMQTLAEAVCMITNAMNKIDVLVGGGGESDRIENTGCAGAGGLKRSTITDIGASGSSAAASTSIIEPEEARDLDCGVV